MAQVVGIDIGYSNLKAVCGSHDGATPDVGRGNAVVVPSGAAPVERVGRAVFGADAGVQVSVHGRPWIAGVPQDAVTNWERTLDAKYPQSDAYMALYIAGLRLLDVGEVQLLVTGLPVDQFKDANYRREVQARLTGLFELGSGRRALVRNVTIVPQPLGGFSDALNEYAELEQESVLVIDPGFFSVDWVLINNGKYLPDHCSSSVYAVSSIIERAMEHLHRQGVNLKQMEVLESGLRSGQKTLKLGGKVFELEGIFAAASLEVGRTAMGAISRTLRGWGRQPDRIVLVGGGARLYEAAVRETFAAETVKAASSPVLANAKGFWIFGANKLLERTSA